MGAPSSRVGQPLNALQHRILRKASERFGEDPTGDSVNQSQYDCDDQQLSERRAQAAADALTTERPRCHPPAHPYDAARSRDATRYLLGRMSYSRVKAALSAKALE